MSSSEHSKYIRVCERSHVDAAAVIYFFASVELPETAIPEIQSTIESPLVYAYRTKITPHFERPPKWAKKDEVKPGEQPPWLKIGFNVTNTNSTMDIEVCRNFFLSSIIQRLIFAPRNAPLQRRS